MDANRLDDAVRLLAARASRRGLIGGLAAGLLAALPFPLLSAEVAAKKKGKRKKKKKNEASCPPCQSRQQGKCLPSPWGTPCEDNPCKECQNGTCANKPNDSACQGAGRCLNGVCNPPPTCTPAFQPCYVSLPPLCCGDNLACWSSVQGTTPTCRGYFGGEGSPCHTGIDCRSQECIGYRCTYAPLPPSPPGPDPGITPGG
jgi:hypothetical protein